MPTFSPKYCPGRRGFLGGSAALAGISLMPRGSLSAEEKKVNFYNWDTYIGENTLEDFEEATGIEAKMDLYADNDELFAKLKEGNPGYDLIVPTNDYVERMLAAGMLVPLNYDLIPNISNIDPVFREAEFDPGRRFSVAYMWGTIGLGFRSPNVEGIPASWKWLYDSDKYSGKIALLGDGQNVLTHAMKYMGYSLNDTDPAHIKEAEEMVIAQKPHIKVFADDNGQDLLASGEVDLTQEWNGDLLQVMEEDDEVSFVVPDEGGLLWQDCLCIPADAPHPQNAHALINFILDAEAGAAIADFIQYATPNKAARALMDDSYNKNPAIFPTEATIAKCEVFTYKGEDVTRMFDEAWTRVQAA